MPLTLRYHTGGVCGTYLELLNSDLADCASIEGSAQPIGPVGDGTTQVVLAICLMCCSGQLLGCRRISLAIRVLQVFTAAITLKVLNI